jgi:arylformamidase
MTWSPDVIDLTWPMTEDTIIKLAGKMVEGDSPYRKLELSYLRDWDRENGTVCQWTLNDHFGTHLDSPYHLVPGAPSVDRVDLNHLIGEAVVIDVSFANGRGLTSEDFERALPRVQPGDIVLIYSAEQFDNSLEEYITKQTYVMPDGAEWLVRAGVKAVGVQPFSFEHFYEGIFVHDWYNKATPEPHWPAHQAVLKHGVYIIEGVHDMERIVGKRVRFSAMPLPVVGSSGSPVRAIAWED